ncbi:MAG: glycosyltransferase [Clostridium sp.]|nr:glycosyltransferase [Candidatus Gastranaerophilales bacterium]MCM1528309.1 glycosyltransferase [Bacteroides sp.]MCM1563694.1 glycosyltransferase [Clostridium sp.]
MGEQIVLSISLLASNRKETTGKCLDSLKPIMEQIPSELIIVDTGCDEELRDILKEYTDHIIPFRWCDDFSAARNAGLKQAKGEWFLYIDDDEWFTDVAEIVEFFRSGEYKEYGQAFYIQRNFKSRKGTEYSDAWVSRMIRREKDTRFVSSIHEYLAPVRGEAKFLKSPASHYGYVFDSPEEMYQHSKRNVTLLLEMMEKEKDNTRWWIHLAQEYQGIKEYNSLHDLCRRGISYFAKADAPIVNKNRGLFYVGCVRADLKRGLYEDAVKDYEEAIRDKRNTELCQAALHINGAAVYMKTEQYEKAAECCRKYLELQQKFVGNDLEMVMQGSLFVRDFFGKDDRNSACGMLIICELKQGKNQALKQYFESFGWEEGTLYFNFDIIPVLLNFWSGAEYDNFYARAAELLMQRNNIANQTIQGLREREKTLSKDAFLRLARIFAGVDADFDYILYLRILYQGSCGNYSDLPDNLKELFERQADFLCLPDKIWDIAEKNEVDLRGIFERVEFDRWRAAVDILAEKSNIDEILKKRERWFSSREQDGSDLRTESEASGAQKSADLPTDMETLTLRRDYFMLQTAEALLIKGHYSDSCENLYRALAEYVDGNLELYGAFFNDNAFSGEMAFLPPSCRLALQLGEALLSERDGNDVEVLKAYKDCLNIYPAMDGVIRRYAHLYREKMAAEKEEFDRLKETLKDKVRQLIDDRAYEEARLILEKLREVAPEEAGMLSELCDMA